MQIEEKEKEKEEIQNNIIVPIRKNKNIMDIDDETRWNSDYVSVRSLVECYDDL